MLFGRIFLAFVNSKKKVLAHLDFFFLIIVVTVMYGLLL